MIQFIRDNNNPIIKKIQGSFHSIHAANPDFLIFKNMHYLYFRGQDEKHHDQIGVGFCSPEKFNGKDWEMHPQNPVIEVGINPDDFDSRHILDPGTIEIDGKVYLYYSGHSLDKSKLFSVGLAISEDGIHFQKYNQNPVIYGAICPEIIEVNKKYYLFYQRLTEKKCFQIYCSTSTDGIHFSAKDEMCVFSPSNIKGAFDEFSISTVRIWEENGWFYMTYGGCNKYFDYPIAIGLARSKDILNWERYPENPVLGRGEKGKWDEAALWFATVYKNNKKHYLWYEGVGTGLGLDSENSKRKSEIARNEDYGGYEQFSFSQIGLAAFTGNIIENWP